MKAFALLTCDSVTIEQATGKHFIFGHFSAIKVNAFPATHPSLTVFVGLTEVPAGEHQVELKFGLPTAEPVKTKRFPWDPPAEPNPMPTLLSQTLKSEGPSQRLYLISEVKELRLEKAGEYALGLVIGQQEVARMGLSIS